MEGTNLMDGGRCTATAKQTGQQCKNRIKPGATVCHVHGGKAPQTQRAVERRLAEARDDALALLARQVRDDLLEPGTSLKATVELTELIETLEGRVARREEHVSSSPVDRELQQLADELRQRADHGAVVAGGEVPVAENGTSEAGNS